MSRAARLALAGLLAAMGCGGGSSGSSGPLRNAFTGTVTITSANTTGSTCQATHTVSFLAASAGVSTHTVSAAGGDCLTFVNDDSVNHQPAPIGGAGCTELSAAPDLLPTQSFTTVPFGGPGSCDWEDADHPPTVGSGGGGS